MDVMAIDNDLGKNGEVHFNISKVKDYIYFKISNQGNLTVNGTLDKEDPFHHGEYQVRLGTGTLYSYKDWTMLE